MRRQEDPAGDGLTRSVEVVRRWDSESIIWGNKVPVGHRGCLLLLFLFICSSESDNGLGVIASDGGGLQWRKWRREVLGLEPPPPGVLGQVLGLERGMEH